MWVINLFCAAFVLQVIFSVLVGSLYEDLRKTQEITLIPLSLGYTLIPPSLEINVARTIYSHMKFSTHTNRIV